ncbi:unnamed protein product, partial [Symbiodinium pilosum]
TDLRAEYDPSLYCMDASPHGGAVCSAQIGKAFSLIVSKFFRGTGNWSICHQNAGLVVHAGYDLKGPDCRQVDVLDGSIRRELVALALRRVVREWHAGVPCVSFGTLRRPRVRSRAEPAGFQPDDSFTRMHNSMARRVAFVFCIAVQFGQFISVEQPAGTSLYHLHCYRVLVTLGCVVSTFCFCSFGSPCLKRSRWLRNKPWLCRLECSCACGRDRRFEVRGTFTAERLAEFAALAKPSVEAVYGLCPKLGQSVAEFSGAYPLRLAASMASGSLAASRGHTERMPLSARIRAARWLGLDSTHLPPVHEPGLPTFPEREWFEDPEWISEICLLDSRVTIGAAAKGRSSSYASDNVADGPSRGSAVPSPSRSKPRWLEKLLLGDPGDFDKVVLAARIKKIPARWLRFLLLLGGDIERNPGPAPPRRRGPLDLAAGFAPSTAKKMAVFESSVTTATALRAFGLHLYENGFPRYLYVYAITAVQDKYPAHRNFLTEAWQVDKKWQRTDWKLWAGLVMIGFLAMLHPAELVALTRKDLVFPADTLGHTTSLFVHLRNPKTSRFARRQHGRIDDPCAIRFLESLYAGLGLEQKLCPASLHSFRRQWDAVLSRLGIPCRAAQQGATSGVLRGSGATRFYICTENIPLLAWRGRWARTKTLEYYLQEVAAQVLFLGLSEATRSRIRVLDKASDAL